MSNMRLHSLRQFLIGVGSAVLLGACADQAPVTPIQQGGSAAQLSAEPGAETGKILATLRSVTARYHNLSVATDDGFVLLHPCESRPDEGPVGVVYVNFDRLLDGNTDPELPDALIYEPGPSGLKLVGVEFAVVNTGQPAPQFLGATFQREDAFGVYALHAWVWRNNPNGMFAQTNPKVSCGE